MAQVIAIEVNAKTSEAKKNLEALNDTIAEQAKITAEFRKELVETQNKLAETSKKNLAARKELLAKEQQLKVAIKEQGAALTELRAKRTLASRDLKKINENLKEQNQQTKSLVALGDQLTGGLFSAFNKGVSSIKSVSLAFNGLRAAIISTGIGALIVALGTLISYFTQTQRGIDLVDKTLAGLKAGFDVIIDRVSMFGEGLWNILSGNFSEGLKVLKSSFEGIGDEIANEVGQAKELQDALRKLELAEIEFIKTRAEKEKQISKLRAAAEDELKTNEQRAALTRQAIQLEKELLDEELKNAQERERIIKEQNQLGESLNEDLKKEAEAQAEVDRIETKRFNRLRQLQSDLNRYIEKQKEFRDVLDQEKDGYKEDLEFADMLADELFAKRDEYIKKRAEGEAFLTKKLEEEQKKQLANDEAAARAKIIYEEEVFNTKVQLANNAANVAAGISELLGRENKNSKTAAIASVLFSQGAALASALRNSQSPTPDNIASGGLAGIAKFGVIAASIAQTVARVRSIINSAPQVEGFSAPSFGGGGGSFSVGGGSGFTPLTPSIVSPTPIQDVNVVNPQSGVRAYVVESDITNSQTLTKTLNRRSRL